MKLNDCIFCKLANGDIPSNTLYEDDFFRVILDLSPASKGHCLILPKEHFKNIFDLSEEYASKALVIAQKMSIILKDILQCDGFNILQNNEECAGQTVMHFHIHIIPRYINDSVGLKFNSSDLDNKFAKDLIESIQEKLK